MVRFDARIARSVTAAVSLVVLIQRPAGAQIPETFTNLKVLPRDITRPALIRLMRGIAGDLGLRCHNCHVGGDSVTLQGVDFASDSLEQKRVARRMLEMVATINRDYIDRIAPDSASRIAVTCGTCHRRVSRPEPIESVVRRIVAQEGLPKASAEYRRLRAIYYGSASYDFSDLPLRVLAADMAASGGKAEALGILRLNLEHHPGSSPSYAMLGRIVLSNGDTAQGIGFLERALELAPGDRFLQAEIERVRGKRR